MVPQSEERERIEEKEWNFLQPQGQQEADDSCSFLACFRHFFTIPDRNSIESYGIEHRMNGFIDLK